MDRPLTDQERFPLITPDGQAMLKRLREHPHAPRYNHTCGDRLDEEGLAKVRAYAEAQRATARGWKVGDPPTWVVEFVRYCLREVPVYRRRGGDADKFAFLPTTDRSDLGAEPWAFVPDDAPLEDLIVYDTSGRTGHPLDILCHPITVSQYLPLLETALEAKGVRLEGGAGRVALLTICCQRSTYTFPSVSAYLGGAGTGKVNLHLASWRAPEDRVQFLDDLNAEVYSGDPLAFAELVRLPLASRPKALISTAMTLLPGLAAELEARFACPVVDLYSLNESGPVAFRTVHGMEILPHDLYVEVLRPDGSVCAPGERGEVTLTGGRNPFLPLLRYRTGDWAAMRFDGAAPTLLDLDGRPPVLFRTPEGALVNNVDITLAMRPFALAQFSLHQAADGALILRVRGGIVDEETLCAPLRTLFGAEQRITVTPLSEEGDKVLQYTSDLVGLAGT